jgi:uncharacterized membrane protein YidH (DUF202 family)
VSGPPPPSEHDPSEGPEPADGERVLDEGLQHERTALAWDRTALAVLVVGALVLRSGGPPYDDLRHAPGYLGVAAGAALLWAGGRRYRRRERELRLGGPGLRSRLVVRTGVLVIALAVAALVVVLTT